jgi:hypothetical protein
MGSQEALGGPADKQLFDGLPFRFSLGGINRRRLLQTLGP